MPSNPSSLVILYKLYALFICAHCFFKQARGKKNSHTGTRTRVGEVKTRYPNRLDYMGLGRVSNRVHSTPAIRIGSSVHVCMNPNTNYNIKYSTQVGVRRSDKP